MPPVPHMNSTPPKQRKLVAKAELLRVLTESTWPASAGKAAANAPGPAMKIDGWHVLLLALAMLFVIALALIAWKAGAEQLWPIAATAGGAIVTILLGLFRGTQMAARFNQRND